MTKQQEVVDSSLLLVDHDYHGSEDVSLVATASLEVASLEPRRSLAEEEEEGGGGESDTTHKETERDDNLNVETILNERHVTQTTHSAKEEKESMTEELVLVILEEALVDDDDHDDDHDDHVAVPVSGEEHVEKFKDDDHTESVTEMTTDRDESESTSDILEEIKAKAVARSRSSVEHRMEKDDEAKALASRFVTKRDKTEGCNAASSSFLERVKARAMATSTRERQEILKNDFLSNDAASPLTLLERVKLNGPVSTEQVGIAKAHHDDDETPSFAQTPSVLGPHTEESTPNPSTTDLQVEVDEEAQVVVGAAHVTQDETVIPMAERVEEPEKAEYPVAIPDEDGHKRRFRRRLFGVGIVLVSLVTALVVGFWLGLDRDSSPSAPMEEDPPSNYTLANLDLFKRAVNKTDLWNLLKGMDDGNGTGTYTILAPTDQAFLSYRIDYTNVDENYELHLREILFNHIFPGTVFLNDFEPDQTITMLSGNTFQVNALNQAPIGNVSFAPVFLGSGTIVQPDLVPEPGLVVHGIDAFLQADFLSTGPFKLAQENNLTRVGEWLQYGGYTSLLAELTEFTVFLPTNEAVDSMPPETFNVLRSRPSFLLETFAGHAASDLYYRKNFKNGTTIEVATTEFLTINIWEDGTLTLTRGNNTARIVKTDLLPYNGVMHVIDNFLLPAEVPVL